MQHTSTARTESRGLSVEWVENLPAAQSDRHGVSVGGLATYYRLRCIALEATVAALEAELDRRERHHQTVLARYEDVLQGRECDCEVVVSD
jgi:hypothetical protein